MPKSDKLHRAVATEHALRCDLFFHNRLISIDSRPMTRAFPSVVIENLQPLVDGGRYPVKRVVGEDLVVEADVFKDGHDMVAAVLRWRLVGETRWHETPMSFVDNDRWRGVCTFYEVGVYEYTVEAWTDTFRGWQHEFTTKFEAGISVLTSGSARRRGVGRDGSATGACGRRCGTVMSSLLNRSDR